MSRFILGDCVQVMSRFPARAVDFILTDPPYLVGYKDRTGRTLAGDNSAEWLQPACHESKRLTCTVLRFVLSVPAPVPLL